MNLSNRSIRQLLTPPLVLALCSSLAFAIEPSESTPKTTEPDSPVTLNPFQVSTSSDKGYKATNAISGTRLDSSIKDLPMPLEVITSEFIQDTGSYNLRDSLRYSAGIQLQSQNDYLGNGNAQYNNPGGVNNPNAQTANKTDTSIIIRGFTTDNALRDGFRRKVTTDSVNISRIEVVRGPAALLYGIGNFGGVVNYLVKAPEDKQRGQIDFMFGSYGLKRGTIDLTGPVSKDTFLGKVNYRITAAAQENGDYTDLYSNKKFSVAPIFIIKPWDKTEITIDTEYGEGRASAIGFQSLRARADITNLVNGAGGLEHAGFLTFPGQNLRTMRYSGSDTYQNTYQGNIEIKVTQNLLENLNLLAAYDHSSVSFHTRDVNAAVTNNMGPQSLWSTIYPVPLDAGRGDTDANWTSSPVPHSIIAYSWADTVEGTRSDQARVELNYKLDLLMNHKWIALKNNLLAGVSTEKDNNSKMLKTLDSANGVFDWKSASDPTPFRFATQGDGSASLPLKARHWNNSVAKESGEYLIYQGKFVNDMVTVLAGIRRDKNNVATNDIGYNYTDGSIDLGATNSYAPSAQTSTTHQFGLSFAPIKAISFYGMFSQGLNPNFSGARDLTGAPMNAVKAVDREFGMKFDFWNGRISGTISHYKITRDGQPNNQFWWAPQTAVHRFDPNKPTVFNVTDLNPDAALKYTYTDNTGAKSPLIQWNNNYAWYGDLTKYNNVPSGAQGSTASASGLQSYKNDGLNSERAAIQNAWTAAKASGAVKYWDKNGGAISESQFASLVSANGTSAGYITVNASTNDGATYMDSIFNYSRDAGSAHPGSDNWPGGFFWNPAPASTGYNIAAQDGNSFANPSGNLSAGETDRNTGWDGQLILTPTDDWQILFSFEKNNHTIISLGKFPTYPYYAQDRWTPWLFPNGQWGLAGYYGKNVQYSNEADSSTYNFKGLVYPGAQGMDYPKWSWSAFTTYRFDHIGIKCLRLGGGAIRTGPQEYESGYTHTGDALKDNSGLPLILATKARWTINVFARYEFKWAKHDTYVQLNVDNLLDDRSKYGLLYAPGRSINLGFGAAF